MEQARAEGGGMAGRREGTPAEEEHGGKTQPGWELKTQHSERIAPQCNMGKRGEMKLQWQKEASCGEDKETIH